MKISAKQYAQALLEIVDSKKNEVEVDKAVLDFSNLLKNNNQLEQLDKILYYFVKLYNKEHNIVEAEVVSKTVLSSNLLNQIESYLNALEEDAKVEIKQKSSGKIIGGVVIKYGDKILDNSLKTRLRQLKTSLLK